MNIVMGDAVTMGSDIMRWFDNMKAMAAVVNEALNGKVLAHIFIYVMRQNVVVV